MKKVDAARRSFLVRAAASAGAVAGAGFLQGTFAQDGEHLKDNTVSPTHSGANAEEHRAFFNREQAATMAAFTERIMPGAPGKAGAREAGVLNYIDLALAGAYSDQQDFYRRGLEQLDVYCRKIHNASFARLDPAQQDEVIAALEDGKASGFTFPTAQAFFNTVRTHTMEGMFADPIYGGNKDFAGWRLVGFPGAQAIFTPTDLQNQQAFTRAPLIGLQTHAPTTNAEEVGHGKRKN